MARTHHGFSQMSGRPMGRREAVRANDFQGGFQSNFQAQNRVFREETPRTRLRHRLAFAVGPTLLLAMGVTVVASAQSSSPFANKKKVQAWEVPEEQATTQTQTTTSSTQTTGAPALRGLRTMTPSTAPAPVRSSSPAPAPSQSVTARRTAPAVPVQNQVRSQTQSQAQAQVQSQTQTQTRVQTQTTQQASTAVPSPTYTYRAQGSAQSAPTTSPTYQSSSRWALGSNNGRTQAGVQPGTSRSMQQRSVNAPPSHQSLNNPDADYRVHELPGRPRANPTQQGGYGSGLAGGQTYAGNAAAGGAYGNNPQGRSVQRQPNQGQASQGQRAPNASAQARAGWGQYGPQSGGSQNPTAYDYGYGQQAPNQQGGYDQSGYNQGGYNQGPNTQGGYQQGAYDQNGPYANQPRRGFFDRMGLGALTTLIRGGLRAGVAARESDGWKEAFIGDADLEVEVSAITQGGLEWGIHTQARAQYDEDRIGFTRRLPDCPPTTLGCPSIIVVATPTGLRGHTTQFYTSGPDVAKDSQIALESAHLFLRSAYGDVTIGRDDGAAYLFSLGAPSLMNVGASNSPVDYTGLDSVKTLNDASGFSEKITYTSPRLLGDQVGLGVQLGVSYSLDSSACGVDYCVDLNSVTDVVAPDIQDVMEAGIALDRTLAPGVSVEGTLTYARGSEKSGLVGLDNLQSYGAGLEFKMNQWTLGGSWLSSNQGLVDGDYQAYDVGLTWQPSRLGFSLGYGHATDDLVGLSSNQILGGVSFDVNDKVRLGLGVQHADRETLRDVAGTAQLGSEKATALFLEGGITF